MSNRTCTVDECGTKHYAKGNCRKHYMAARYQANIDEERATRAAWRAANPDYMKSYNPAYYSDNRDALKASAAAWKEANPERKKANDASWSERNRERKNSMNRKRWHSDPERGRALHAAWYRRNKNKAKEADSRRRALMLANGYEVVDFGALLLEHGMVCHICKLDIPDESDLHFDHVIPLAKGGPHAAHNIRPAHAFCNRSKGARILTD